MSAMYVRRFLMVLTFVHGACLAADPDQPEEAGKVKWLRDLDTALLAGSRSGKPVFALFQEIPGCAGCKQFGREVLSHPLVVAGIESEFMPLLIHNNKPGKDAEVLRRFGEPAWNYQVVRFLDAQGSDLHSSQGSRVGDRSAGGAHDRRAANSEAPGASVAQPAGERAFPAAAACGARDGLLLDR